MTKPPGPSPEKPPPFPWFHIRPGFPIRWDEIASITLLVVTLFFYTPLTGIKVQFNLPLYWNVFYRVLKGGLALLIIVWFVLHMMARGVGYLRVLADWRSWVLLVRNTAGFFLASILYTHWKAALARFFSHRHDALLMTLDTSLALGHRPHEILWKIAPPTNTTVHLFMDTAYKWFFLVVCFSFLANFLRADFTRFTRYTMAIVFTYYAGLVGYYLVPAYGPIFAYPRLFSNLPPSWVGYIQTAIYQATITVRRAPNLAVLIPFGYIAAFPSLHVAHGFQAYYYFGPRTFLGVALLIYLVAMTLSTLYFGMHYVIDWPAGLLLGWGGVWVVERISRPGPLEG